MSEKLSLNKLWYSPASPAEPFLPDKLSNLPEPVTRYLTHAIKPGTPLSQAVRLR